MNLTTKYPGELSQIVEYLSRPDIAIQFLQETHIAEISQIQSIQRYTRPDNHQGLVMNVTEKGVSDGRSFFYVGITIVVGVARRKLTACCIGRWFHADPIVGTIALHIQVNN